MRIGLDLAKKVFEVYAVDRNQAFLFRKTLKRQKFLTEFRIILPQGRCHIRSKLPTILDDADNNLPYLAREAFADQYHRLCELDRIINEYDRVIDAMTKLKKRLSV